MANKTPEVKYHKLPGRWYRVGQLPNKETVFLGDAVELIGQNGYFGTYRKPKHVRWTAATLPVFVVMTGPSKGVWVQAETINR